MPCGGTHRAERLSRRLKRCRASPTSHHVHCTDIPQRTVLEMPDARRDTLRATLSASEDRLYSINPDKQVLSVPVTGSPTVVQEWTVPGATETFEGVGPGRDLHVG